MKTRSKRRRRIVKSITALLAITFATALGCGISTTERLGLGPLKTVEYVELERYLGTWYEIARFPQSFQEGCVASTATYTLRDDGLIDVLNTCRNETLDGEERSALGLARVVDAETNAKLQVTFFLFFWGDYWIIDLADDYSWAVVGHPSRDYLWILSRTPTMDAEVYSGILQHLEAVGYETERLYVTPQVETDTG
ncbi:MAG TPA: lipocalin family protein [bacterium]|nr:lipocalin family protein [bacterium]